MPHSLEEQLRDQLHVHVSTVYNFLQTLKFIYDEFSLDEFLVMVDPSLDELEKIVHELQCEVSKFDTRDDLLLENRRISLRQSLLEAERLLIAVRHKNQLEFDKIGKSLNPMG